MITLEDWGIRAETSIILEIPERLSIVQCVYDFLAG